MNIPSPFTAVDVEFDKTTEMALLLDSVAGHLTITYGPTFPGQGNATTGYTSTGLANDTTSYTATITIDATGTPHVVSYAANGSTIQTFAALIASLQTAVGVNATVSMVGGDIIITSATTGVNSSVTYTDTGAHPLFGSIAGSNWKLVNSSSVRGGVDYAVWNSLDSGTKSNVSTVIDSFLAATTANTNQPWTNGSDAITFPTGSPTGTTSTGLTYTTVYDLNVAVDGGSPVNLLINLNIPETQVSPVSFNQLFTAIGNALVAQNVAASVVPVYSSPLTLRIASNSVGTTSTLVITAGTSNDLLTALAAFGPVNAPATTAGTLTAAFAATPAVTGATVPGIGAAGTNYDIKLAIHGGAATVYTISVASTDSMTVIAGKINTAITALASCAVSGNAFLFTDTGTPGLSSKVVVTHPAGGANADLFDTIATALTATLTFTEVDGTDAAGVNGATNVSFPVTKTLPVGNERISAVSTVFSSWNDVLQLWPSPTGFGPLFTTGTSAIVRKLNKPAAKGNCVRTAVYYNGTNWVYFDNDTAIGGTGTTVSPPEVR